MRLPKLCLVLLALCFLLPGHANGAEPALPNTPLPAAETDAVLARLRAGMQNMTSLRADFTQKKRLALFSQAVTSQGKLHFRLPDSLRWEYETPVRSGFVVTGGKGAAWSEAGGEKHKSDLKDSAEFRTLADQIGIWLTFDEAAIKRQYTAEALSVSPAIIRLTPKNEMVRQFLQQLILVFAPDDSGASQVHIMESGGDSTILHFHNMTRGETLPDALFTP